MENMNERTNGDHIVAQALETALGNKVEKKDGKGLSSNDYTDAEKEKLAGIPVLDYTSLEEQIVPGEFWLGTDGVKRQVYMRTLLGVFTTVSSRIELLTNVDEIQIVRGYTNQRNVYHMPANAIFASDSGAYETLNHDWLVYVSGTTAFLAFPKDSFEFQNGKYSITLKYTKA